MMEWIRFAVVALFLLASLCLAVISVAGVFKFKFVLNRMHAAAIGDTLGLGSCLTGLILLSGFNITSVKLALVLVFLWLASPVASHLIARLEVVTNEQLAENCELPREKWEDELC